MLQKRWPKLVLIWLTSAGVLRQVRVLKTREKLKLLSQKQKKLHKKRNSCPPTGKVKTRIKRKIEKNYLMNDVSMALWAKARSHHELGQIDLAKQTYGQCVYMTCGRAWDPKGWFWSPAKDCADKARALLK